MQWKLYQADLEDRDPVYVLARTSHRASLVFIVSELDAGRSMPNFTIKRSDNKLPADQRVGLDDLLSHGSQGIVTYDPALGWCAAR